jgi:cobalt-zinc-cadmium efflux system outer membrane protein
MQTHIASLGTRLATLEQLAAQGKATAMHCKRAALLMRQAELNALAATEQLAIARLELARLWEKSSIDFDNVTFSLYTLQPPPPLTALKHLVANNPQQERAQAALKTACATLQRERTEWYPTVAINAGLRTFYETKDHAYTVGLAIPLPLFHRNQGHVHSANAALCRAELQNEQISREQTSALVLAHRQCESALQRAALYSHNLLPEIESSVTCTLDAYHNGKSSYPEVLDAEQLLFENKLAYLDSLLDYHRSKITLTFLTGSLPTDCP